jgi:hypothetical protein
MKDRKDNDRNPPKEKSKPKVEGEKEGDKGEKEKEKGEKGDKDKVKKEKGDKDKVKKERGEEDNDTAKTEEVEEASPVDENGKDGEEELNEDERLVGNSIVTLRPFLAQSDTWFSEVTTQHIHVCTCKRTHPHEEQHHSAHTYHGSIFSPFPGASTSRTAGAWL